MGHSCSSNGRPELTLSLSRLDLFVPISVDDGETLHLVVTRNLTALIWTTLFMVQQQQQQHQQPMIKDSESWSLLWLDISRPSSSSSWSFSAVQPVSYFAAAATQQNRDFRQIEILQRTTL